MGDKCTILYIGGFELPDKNAAAHLVLNNAKIFSLLGHNVMFCGVNKKLNSSTRNYHERIGDYDSFPRPYPKRMVDWLLELCSINSYKRVLGKNSNIKFVVAYNIHFIQMIKMVKLCKKNGIFFISNVTEWYENKFSIHPIKLIKFFDTLFVMRILNKKVGGIITNSSYIERYYHNYVKNILVMPPLVDIYDKKWSERRYKCDSRVRFVYSGSPEQNGTKDKLLPVIKCFEKLSSYDYIFEILGITKEQFLLQYPEMTEYLERVKDKVVFYGRVSHTESVEKLFNSDFSIIIRDATRKNNAGFPTKFVEGYTSGINIIASNISDIEMYFPKNDYSVLLSNNDEKTISSVLQKILELDVSDIRNKRRDGLSNNPFDYKKWVKKVKEFFACYN